MTQPGAEPVPAIADDSSRSRVARGLRVHGLLDLGFAALHGWLGFVVAPGRGAAWNAALALVVALLAAAGVALLAGVRVARAIALCAQGLLLAFCLTVITLLVASAAYLRGIYGPIGEGIALLALVAAALVVELSGLLPLFQIGFLLSADVRRHFGGR